MNYLGIDYSVKNMPLLDNAFIPFGVWAEAYLKEAVHPFKIAIERENGFVSVFETKLRSDAFAAANYRYAGAELYALCDECDLIPCYPGNRRV